MTAHQQTELPASSESPHEHPTTSEAPLELQQWGSSQQSWKQKLAEILETMQELSSQTDPQQMVYKYGQRMMSMFPSDRVLAISRRDLEAPWFRMTRNSDWKEEINPWKDASRLPLLKGGLLAELLYNNTATVISDLNVDPSDPAYDYLSDLRSLRVVPLFDKGESLNMVLHGQRKTSSFSEADLPEVVWISNLFGRATHNLVMAEQLEKAYTDVDRELNSVASIQRSLLPEKVPEYSHLTLSTHYETAHRAGGDYYDFFPLPDDKLGILIADVSGHGTPAAVVMSILHTIAHTYTGDMTQPAKVLEYLNDTLCKHYTAKSGAFVTAFYGVFNNYNRSMIYASAGHNPPRMKRCGKSEIVSLDQAGRIPLGITDGIEYDEAQTVCHPNDRIIFYTDGIIESMNPADEQFGMQRLDQILTNCKLDAQNMMDQVLAALKEFRGPLPAMDDQTLVIAEIN